MENNCSHVSGLAYKYGVVYHNTGCTYVRILLHVCEWRMYNTDDVFTSRRCRGFVIVVLLVCAVLFQSIFTSSVKPRQRLWICLRMG